MKFRIFINKQNGQDESIILSSEEISNVDFNITSNDFIGSTIEPHMNIRIAGYFLSSIDLETETNDNPLNIQELINNFLENKLNNLSEGLNKGISILGKNFTSSLNSKLTSITKNIKDFDTSVLQQMNFENLKELAKWALCYGTATDYRDVLVEVFLNENISKIYIIPDMFALDYSESIAQSSGNGHFSIFLKQKLYSDRNIQIL